MDTGRIRKYPRLSRNLDVDVVVVGGGITGITAAYLLSKAGATVALLERDSFAAADTGHTTAHLTYVTDERFSDLVQGLGRDHAQAVWDAGRAAISKIDEIIREEAIPCEFAWVPGYLHSPVGKTGPGNVFKLEKDAELAAEMGFDAEFVEGVPFVRKPGVRFANQAKFHPRKYAAGVLAALPRKGCHVFERSEVEEIKAEPLSVKANGHVIKGTNVILATHVPLQGIAGAVSAALFQTKIFPYTSYALGARIPQGVVPEASFWDTGDPYDYMRVDRRKDHDYVVYGGADHKTGQVRDPCGHYERLEKRLLRLVPEAVIDHRWSGQVIETSDGLPFMGETAPMQYVATGFSGNGMTFGTLGAMMACDAVTGRLNPWQELFDVKRKMVRRGAWDYLKENKDYPYYFIKDRLASPAEKTLRGIKRGEGKIVQKDGRKIAAFRDANGKLSTKSAVCTHMGCIVRWNGADQTWDCPCHGSRFQATGEVIGGPAETPLEDVK